MLATSALCVVLFAWIAPRLPFDSRASFAGALAAYALAFSCVSAMALAAGWTAPVLGGRQATAAILSAVALLAGVSAYSVGGAPGAALVAVSLLGAGALLGAAIGARIEHAGHLGVVALVSSVFDVASVFSQSGPSAQIAQSEAWLSVLALSFPMAGSDAIEPLLGVGDVVFVALYVSAARAHGLALPRTLCALALALALVAITVVASARAIPALPMLGAAMLLAHPAARLPPPAERPRALAALMLLFVALVLGLWARS